MLQRLFTLSNDDTVATVIIDGATLMPARAIKLFTPDKGLASIWLASGGRAASINIFSLQPAGGGRFKNGEESFFAGVREWGMQAAANPRLG